MLGTGVFCRFTVRPSLESPAKLQRRIGKWRDPKD